MAAILDFVDSGRDLILASDVNASDFIREIAIECGVDSDEVLNSAKFCFLFSQIELFYCSEAFLVAFGCAIRSKMLFH